MIVKLQPGPFEKVDVILTCVEYSGLAGNNATKLLGLGYQYCRPQVHPVELAYQIQVTNQKALEWLAKQGHLDVLPGARYRQSPLHGNWRH